MNWKDEAKKELRTYTALKESIRNVQDRIDWIESQKTSIRSASCGTAPVQGGGNKYEDRLLDMIVTQERLRLTLEADRVRLGLIERGLAVMSEQERKVLLTFAAHRSGEAVEILTGEIFVERAQIYRLWDQALYRFTIAEYGITEF